MSLRLFIVDDEAPARERLKTLLTDIADDCPHAVVGEADNAQQALDNIAIQKPEVVLLDVQMPGQDGMELAEKLAQLPDVPTIVFVTAFEEYARQAFDVEAADYLLKPVRAARLMQALQRAKRKRVASIETSGRQHFSVMERGRLLMVPVQEVLFLKAEMKYLTLHTCERDYLIEASLAAIEEEFSSIFVRVHRNALVARNAIKGVERNWQSSTSVSGDEQVQDSWEVVLKDSPERLPISRRQWPVVKALVR